MKKLWRLPWLLPYLAHVCPVLPILHGTFLQLWCTLSDIYLHNVCTRLTTCMDILAIELCCFCQSVSDVTKWVSSRPRKNSVFNSVHKNCIRLSINTSTGCTWYVYPLDVCLNQHYSYTKQHATAAGSTFLIWQICIVSKVPLCGVYVEYLNNMLICL